MIRDLDRLTRRAFDVVIIGGGIYGAFAAWEASLRGLAVALIEQGDFGQATSANSQRIVHGGLRYLQSLDVPRLRASVRERRMLLKLAPHLVHPMPCVVPTRGSGRHSRPALALAAWVNELLAWDRNRGLDDPDRRIPPSRLVSRAECLKLVPGLPADGLTGGLLWYDAQIRHAERLTLSVVLSAMAAGAEATSYVRAVGVRARAGRVSGVDAQDALTGRRLRLDARVVLNAAGPWVATIPGAALGRRPSFAKAMNLITRPLGPSVAFGVPDRDVRQAGARLLFVTPEPGCSVVGTAYAAYDGTPDGCVVSAEEIDALLAQINRAYPPARLLRSDVLGVQVGLVPVTRPGADPSRGEIDRHPHLWDHGRLGGPDGLISVLGVKWTTARDVAERTARLISAKLGRRDGLFFGERPMLTGGPREPIAAFLAGAARRHPSLPAAAAQELARQYGTRDVELAALMGREPSLAAPVATGASTLAAQVVYAVRAELAVRLSDVVLRRTALASAGRPSEEAVAGCAALMAGELGWDEARVAQELDDTTRQLARRMALAGPLTPQPALAEATR